MKKKAVLVSILFILGLFSVNYLKDEKPMANDFSMKQASMLIQPVLPPAQVPGPEVEDVPRVTVAKEAPVTASLENPGPKTAKATGTKPSSTVSPGPSPKIPTAIVTEKPTVVVPEQPEEKEKAAESVPPAEQTSAQVPAESAGSYSFRSDMEKEIFRLTNEIRAAEGLRTLKWDTTLHSSARNHTRYMFEENVFRHTTKYRVAENIILLASPQKVETYTAQYLVDKWMASEGHRANILNPNITLMGVGVIRGDQYFTKYERELPAIYGTQHFK